MAKRGTTDEGPANLKGPKLRAIRKAKGLSQADLVVLLQRRGWDIDPMVLNRIEMQRRTLSDKEIEIFAKTLKFKWEDLA